MEPIQTVVEPAGQPLKATEFNRTFAQGNERSSRMITLELAVSWTFRTLFLPDSISSATVWEPHLKEKTNISNLRLIEF